MPKKKITIDDLALMTQKGFLELDAKIELFHEENKKEHEEIKEELQNLQDTTNRIETLQKSELGRTDDLGVRVGRLEKIRM